MQTDSSTNEASPARVEAQCPASTDTFRCELLAGHKPPHVVQLQPNARFTFWTPDQMGEFNRRVGDMIIDGKPLREYEGYEESNVQAPAAGLIIDREPV